VVIESAFVLSGATYKCKHTCVHAYKCDMRYLVLGVCVCARVCARARVHVCVVRSEFICMRACALVRACVCACVRLCVGASVGVVCECVGVGVGVGVGAWVWVCGFVGVRGRMLVHLCARVCMCVVCDACTRECACECVCACACTYIYACVQACMFVHVRVRVCVRVCVMVRTAFSLHLCIHVYMPKCVREGEVMCRNARTLLLLCLRVELKLRLSELSLTQCSVLITWLC